MLCFHRVALYFRHRYNSRGRVDRRQQSLNRIRMVTGKVIQCATEVGCRLHYNMGHHFPGQRRWLSTFIEFHPRTNQLLGMSQSEVIHFYKLRKEVEKNHGKVL